MIPLPLPFACGLCLPHPCACRPCFLQLQLQEATYTPETVEVLRRVAGEVQTAVGTAETRLQQVRLLGGGAKVGVLGACPCLLWAGRLLPMFAAGSHLPPSWKPAAALWRTSEHPCTISDHFWVGFTCSTARLPVLQAKLQLQQYGSLGPSFRAQATEHAAVLQQVGWCAHIWRCEPAQIVESAQAWGVAHL